MLPIGGPAPEATFLYQPLADHVRGRAGDPLEMTFDETAPLLDSYQGQHESIRMVGIFI